MDAASERGATGAVEIGALGSRTLNYCVKLFAQARDLAKCEQIEFASSDIQCVGDLRREIARRNPELVNLLQVSRIAVDHEFVSDEDEVFVTSEIAFIPPVGGG